MNKPTRKIISLLMIWFLCGVPAVSADTDVIPKTADPIREALAGRAPFPSTIDMTPLKELLEILTNFTTSRCPDNALTSLKNPFASALPAPQQSVEEVPAPTPTEQNIPFLPPPVSDDGGKPVPVPKPNFQVQGMVWNSDLPQAIINRTVLSIGDKLNGWTVIEISPQGVKMGIDTTNVYWFTP